MSSKFFTWTKGDRRNASEALRAGSIVTIPAELRINGLEYARATNGSSKAQRKPLSLPLDQYPKQQDGSQEIALHDAAVKSATSLMAVMNEMLKSPPVSAHLAERQRSSGLLPMHGRPRSHTAPSTPVAEAPLAELAELPGSTCRDLRSNSDMQLPQGGRACASATSLVFQVGLGHDIERPRSSPQEPTRHIGSEPRISTDSRPSISGRRPSFGSPLPKPSTATQSLKYAGSIASGMSSCDTLVNPVGTELVKQTPHRPSLAILQSTPPTKTSASIANNDNSGAWAESRQTESLENDFLDQVSLLRTTHETHLTALREAHERELASYRIYIDFLESRSSRQTQLSAARKQQLTIDTSQTSIRPARTDSPASSITLRSLDTNPEKPPTSEINPSVEIESLKRKLSLARKAQSEAADVRRDRDYHRDMAERSGKRITQLKDIVKKTKDTEKALKNAVSSLEADLVEANNQRLDVLEGFHVSCEKINILQHDLSTRDSRVRDLEREVTRLGHEAKQQTADTTANSPTDKADDSPELSSEVQRLREAMEKQQHDLSAAQVERDRYNSLLHSELRRTSRVSAQKAHSATPEISAEAAFHVTETVSMLKARGRASSQPEDGEATKTLLEKELEHCVKEIIMYKLDVKGYKKDLKKAHARIEQLQSSNGKQGATSGDVSSDGLGISLTEDSSPPARSLRTATSAALLAASPPARTSTIRQSASQALLNGTHKKLPKPPSTTSRPPSPLPPHMRETPPKQMQRAETLRSLSESIISSYAHRTTPEQTQDTAFLNRTHGSDRSTDAAPSMSFRHTAPIASTFQFSNVTQQKAHRITA
ncbi:hypothetical protein K431DRAFT_307104 [Polychaeton citri CBS 116435]|uniref:Uncharacterized protein n=1 Tax=Polychaeton citri CBS 116435 TaxID=1314669 RepID=A0A9P4PYF7_9PEZI|nr:hypothetical protein K431DRAFT_307104 [Polychaeton citri CBS 116435]